MRVPFPRWILHTPVKVFQTELSEDGEPVEELIFDELAFYDEKSLRYSTPIVVSC